MKRSLHPLLFILFSAVALPGFTQTRKIKLNLQEVLSIAAQQSIDAFRNQNMYLASYWAFNYYQANRLPGLSLSSSPLDFNRYSQKVYNINTNQDEYVFRKYFNSDVTLSLSQNITPTGGRLFLQSDLNLVQNLGANKVTSYASTPISIGYQQDLNGYNELRWQSRIEPLKFKKAQKSLIQNNETLNLKAVSVFFNLATAQVRKSIAETNLSNADTLYKIGQGRFQVGTVTQDELLTLELSRLNAEQALNEADVTVKRMQTQFNSFLGLAKQTEVDCIMPNQIPGFQVNADEALSLAKQNNPIIIDELQRKLEADKNVASTKADAGLNTTLSALYGLNQTGEKLTDVYGKQQERQQFSIRFNIPIVDWGRRKGSYSMAVSNREVTLAEIKQDEIDFEQQVYQAVLEFNLQASQVYNAAKADTVGQQKYNVTFQRFLIGKIDVVKLNIASTDRENARIQYINALNQYWSQYYQLRNLTLFDFENKKPLTAEYDKILENNK